MVRLLRVAVLLVVVVFNSSVTHAAPVLFDNRADFNAAVGAHALFTDFAVTHIPGTFDFEGNFGGLQFRQEGVQLIWGNALGTTGVFAEGNGGNASLGAYATRPVRAIGFDVLSAQAATGPSPIGFPPVFPDIIPTNLGFAFTTLAGEQVSRSVPPGSFIGALLYDDAFEWVGLATSAGCACHSSFVIDNLAVQAVPEPSTMLLLSAGLMGLVMVRRFRRR